MIEVKKLHKSFGKLKVLNGLDFSIEEGKISAILGPNGSGKTTLIKSILGLVQYHNGDIQFQGKSIKSKWEYRNEIGYLPQIARFPENLSIQELIHLVDDIRNGKSEYQELLEQFGLKDQLHKKIRNLSGGTRQKVNIVLTFMLDCPLYILDEPTNGLDPVALIRLKDLIIEKKKQGKTFLLTTHIMALVEELSDELIFLLEGNIYFKGSFNELMKLQGENNLERSIAKILENAHA